MKNLITIFTPTYNRALLLPQLYDSLINQKSYNFEWIIVDDGSNDNSTQIVEAFIAEAKIPITYFKKQNGGKHLAINMGVQLAQGDLFFIVDSDDYLVEEATQLIKEYYSLISNVADIAGVSFRRGYDEKTYIGSSQTFDEVVLNVHDFRYRLKIKGDMAEVYKTSILAHYPFPEFQGEVFCSEGLVWNRMGLKYKMLWTSKIIYIGDYLAGGLTDNSFNVRKKAANAATLYYQELSEMNVPLAIKIKSVANYWRFASFKDESFLNQLKKVNVFLSVVALPLLLLLKIKDCK
jgi:glycosyltransferase involved in cell wall biosynthesis